MRARRTRGVAEIAGNIVSLWSTYYTSTYLPYTYIYSVEMVTATAQANEGGSKPSPQILKAAQSAISSPHALINLTRLIKSLDSKIPVSEPDDSPFVDTSAGSAIQKRKDWEVGLSLCRANGCPFCMPVQHWICSERGMRGKSTSRRS